MNGNVNVFAIILVNKYEKMIYNLAFYKIGNHEDAQDLTQECFLRAYKILSSYNQSKAAFSTWIYIINRNLIYDFYKKDRNNRNSEISLYISSGDEVFKEIEIADNSSEPSEIITRIEKIQKIRELIYSLTDEQRDIIIMRDINGLSYVEIAEMLNIRISMVKNESI